MELFFDVSSKHKVMNANAPNYPTPLMHPNRILDEHDLIYIRTGEWEIGQGDETFLAREGDVLILSAGQSHYGVSPCRAGTGTMYIHALAHPTDAAAPYLPEISREGVLLQSHIHTHGDVQIKNDDGFELISTNGVMIEKIADEEYGEELMKIYLQLQEQTEDEDMEETEDMDMTI